METSVRAVPEGEVWIEERNRQEAENLEGPY